MKSKLSLYNSLVIPVAIYANETWKSNNKLVHKLDVFRHRCLQKLLKISWFDMLFENAGSHPKNARGNATKNITGVDTYWRQKRNWQTGHHLRRTILQGLRDMGTS